MMVAMLEGLPERARTPAMARAITSPNELSADMGTLQPLGSDVDDLVGELETLRVALEETTR